MNRFWTFWKNKVVWTVFWQFDHILSFPLTVSSNGKRPSFIIRKILTLSYNINHNVSHITYLLHDIAYVPCVQGLHYFTATSMSTHVVQCPEPWSPILIQWCFQAFDFQVNPYTFQLCFFGMAHKVTTSYACFVLLSWQCAQIHVLQIAVLTKTSSPLHILC